MEGGRRGKGVLLARYLVRLFHVGLAPVPLVAHHGVGEGCMPVCDGVG
jgi:hypothetical protein